MPAEPGYDACRGETWGHSASDSRLDTKANRILHRNNAQEIVKALADLEEHRAEIRDAMAVTRLANGAARPSISQAIAAAR